MKPSVLTPWHSNLQVVGEVSQGLKHISNIAGKVPSKHSVQSSQSHSSYIQKIPHVLKSCKTYVVFMYKIEFVSRLS